MNLGLKNFGTINDKNIISDIESQFNTEIECNIAYEELNVGVKFGDTLSTLIDNVYSLQDVANKYDSKEALNVIHDLTDGKLVRYSKEGFVATAWEKIKAFFKYIWEKITGFFKWVWNKLKSLFTSQKKASASPSSSLAKLAEKDPKIAQLVDIKKSSNEAAEIAVAASAAIVISLPVIPLIFDAIAAWRDKMRRPVEVDGALSAACFSVLHNLPSITEQFMKAMNLFSDNLADYKADNFFAELKKYEKSIAENNKKETYSSYRSFSYYVKRLMENYENLKKIDDKVQAKLKAVNETISNINESIKRGDRRYEHQLQSEQLKVKMASAFVKVIAGINKRYAVACANARKVAPKFFDAHADI